MYNASKFNKNLGKSICENENEEKEKNWKEHLQTNLFFYLTNTDWYIDIKIMFVKIGIVLCTCTFY